MSAAELEILRSQIKERLDAVGWIKPAVPPESSPEDTQKEFAHAIDVLAWIHRLTSSPSLSLLLAGRRHDWERVIYPGSTEGFKGDRESQEYLVHKKAHAARSAAIAIDGLTDVDCPEDVIIKTARLILHHDDAGAEIAAMHDPELEILASADTLSFFSCIVLDMLSRQESEPRIKAKMVFMLSKLDAHARQILTEWTSPNDIVNQWKAEVLGKFQK